MPKNHLIDLAVGYEAPADSKVKGKRFVSKEISGSITSTPKRGFSRKFHESLQRMANLITYTSVRTYGLFLGGFGLLTLLIHFAKDYFGYAEGMPIEVVMMSAAFVILAIPFISSDKPIGIAMQDFSLTDSIFFEFFCIQRAQKKPDAPSLHPLIGLLLGIMLAVLGGVVSVWYVVAGMGLAVYVFLTAISPEFSFFLTFLAVPYLPMMKGGEMLLAVLVIATALSFIRKTAEGKRICYIEKYDLLLIVMLLCVFVSGIIVGGAVSLLPSLVMLVLGFGGYILTNSLVANRRLADCVIKANIIASIPISIIAISEFVMALVGGRVAEFAGAAATFGSADMLAAYLLIVFSFALYFVIVRRSKFAKFIYSVYLVLTVVALVLTMRVWVIPVLLVGILAYFVLKIGRFSGLFLGALGFMPYLLLFAPESWFAAASENGIVRALGFDTYFGAWVTSREIFVDNFLVGVGTGDFADAPYSANFLLQIACEAGVFVLIVFLAIFLTRFRHRAIYSPYIKGSQVGLISDFADITIVVILVYGLFTSLWTEPTVYFLFWCIFGLGSAVLRISKSEFDDRVGYFSDGAGVDSSSIDITLEKP